MAHASKEDWRSLKITAGIAAVAGSAVLGVYAATGRIDLPGGGNDAFAGVSPTFTQGPQNCEVKPNLGRPAVRMGKYIENNVVNLDMARAVTVDRATYLSSQTNDPDNRALCVRGKSISVHGRSFDLTNPSDTLLAASIVDGLYNRTNNEARQLEDIDDMLWLQRNVTIEAKNVPPVLPVYQLEQVSRIMQGMKKTGTETPKKLVFLNNRDFNNNGQKDKDTAYFGYNDYSKFYGDVGYEFASFVLKQKPELAATYQTIDPSMDAWNIYSYLRSYLSDGEALRAEMIYDMAQGKKMKTESEKYRIAMAIFGNQYVGHSFPFEPKDYKPNEFARINDVERPDRPGILLRKDDLEKDPELKHVFHGDIVVVTGAPVNKTVGDTIEIYYPVQKGLITVENEKRIFTPIPDEDKYIRDIFLLGLQPAASR